MHWRGKISLFIRMTLLLIFSLAPQQLLSQSRNFPTPDNFEISQDSRGKVQLTWELPIRAMAYVNQNSLITVNSQGHDKSIHPLLTHVGSIKTQFGQATEEIYDLFDQSLITQSIPRDQITRKFSNNTELIVRPYFGPDYPSNWEIFGDGKFHFTLIDHRKKYANIGDDMNVSIALGNPKKTTFGQKATAQKNRFSGGDTTYLSSANTQNYVNNKTAPYLQETIITDENKKIIDITEKNLYVGNFRATHSDAHTTQEANQAFSQFATHQKVIKAINQLETAQKDPLDLTKLLGEQNVTNLFNFYKTNASNQDPTIFDTQLNQIIGDYKKIFGAHINDTTFLRDLFGELLGHDIRNCEDAIRILSGHVGAQETNEWIYRLAGGTIGEASIGLGGGLIGSIIAGGGSYETFKFLDKLGQTSLDATVQEKIKKITIDATLLQYQIEYLKLAELNKGLKRFKVDENTLQQGFGLNPHKFFRLQIEQELLQNRFKDCLDTVRALSTQLQNKCDVNLPLLGDVVCSVNNLILGWSINLAKFAFDLLMRATTLQ